MNYDVKYYPGEEVLCHGVPGMVTAVTIRDNGGRCYEFTYVSNEGNPVCISSRECELKKNKMNDIGFKGNK